MVYEEELKFIGRKFYFFIVYAFLPLIFRLVGQPFKPDLENYKNGYLLAGLAEMTTSLISIPVLVYSMMLFFDIRSGKAQKALTKVDSDSVFYYHQRFLVMMIAMFLITMLSGPFSNLLDFKGHWVIPGVYGISFHLIFWTTFLIAQASVGVSFIQECRAILKTIKSEAE